MVLVQFSTWIPTGHSSNSNEAGVNSSIEMSFILGDSVAFYKQTSNMLKRQRSWKWRRFVAGQGPQHFFFLIPSMHENLHVTLDCFWSKLFDLHVPYEKRDNVADWCCGFSARSDRLSSFHCVPPSKPTTRDICYRQSTTVVLGTVRKSGVDGSASFAERPAIGLINSAVISPITKCMNSAMSRGLNDSLRNVKGRAATRRGERTHDLPYPVAVLSVRRVTTSDFTNLHLRRHIERQVSIVSEKQINHENLGERKKYVLTASRVPSTQNGSPLEYEGETFFLPRSVKRYRIIVKVATRGPCIDDVTSTSHTIGFIMPPMLFTPSGPLSSARIDKRPSSDASSQDVT
ncbi:hypothetical protein EVAR_96540_1 [Eumeta japonica]|uniref:Uncharacterized protein n=1 Tax=Eumeta variegata TaxID=151549 RepID=A0A4C1WFF3_EUMVA|nr:hypothetical protein EVAR_96540_1 [Eumeta japonica]